MGFFKWHEKLTRKISERNLILVLNGKIILIFALAALFSIELVQYSYFILIAAVVILVQYLINNFMQWIGKKKLNYKTHIFGFTGLFLLILFFGVQSPQIPIKSYILIFGILLTIPALFDLLKGKKK